MDTSFGQNYILLNEQINFIRLLLQQKNSHPPFWRMAIPITVVDDYF